MFFLKKLEGVIKCVKGQTLFFYFYMRPLLWMVIKITNLTYSKYLCEGLNPHPERGMKIKWWKWDSSVDEDILLKLKTYSLI
jgi:hypothetical protein